MRYLKISLLLIVISCSKKETDGQSRTCDNQEAIAKFDLIKKGMSYSSIKNIFQKEGDNFRTDNDGTYETKFYKWNYPCKGINYYVQCWIREDKVILVTKTIKRNNCSANLAANSLNIKTGMAYEEVKSILQHEGDNFRNDYRYEQDGQDMAFYRWYVCNTQLKFIEVWFTNGKATLITKSL